MAVKKQIAIKTEIDCAVDEVFLDAAKLKQVLHNYLSNALKFTPDGGRIIVRAVADDESQFRIEVVDTGIGISRRRHGSSIRGVSAARFQQRKSIPAPV